MAVGSRLIVAQHEQPDSRRQVAVRPAGIDARDQVRQGHVPADRNILQALPESVLETDTGLVSSDDDRALDDRRLHCPSPVSTRCWSRLLRALSLTDRV